MSHLGGCADNHLRTCSVLARSLVSAAAAFDVIQITDNDGWDGNCDISGPNVVWASDDGNDSEIYITTISNPVPSISFGGLALLGGLLLSIGVLARRCWQRR